MNQTRNQLRRSIIQKRALLTDSEITHASNKIALHLAKSLLFLQSERIAFYFANKGEVDSTPLFIKALKMYKECFFPVLHPIKHNKLWFARYKPGDRLKKNTYGILEPEPEFTQLIEPLSLDLVITPLVAFDPDGHRLGMGGGFYDRTFAFRKESLRAKPFLLGLAYDFQRVDSLDHRSWDVSLNGVVTEEGLILF